jgi:hypothetical protein
MPNIYVSYNQILWGRHANGGQAALAKLFKTPLRAMRKMMPWKPGFERSVAEDAIPDVANADAMECNRRWQKTMLKQPLSS